MPDKTDLKLSLSIAIPLAALCSPAPCSAEDWPGWRGPGGVGKSGKSAVPLRWDPGKSAAGSNVLWVFDDPGFGHSSPIVWKDAVYVVSDNGVLSALEARTGEYRGQKRLRGDFSASLLYAAGRIYALLMHQLRKQGTPIPTKDVWIAALVVQHHLHLCDRDQHFDALPQLARL